LHIAQGKKIKFRNFPTAAGAAASTIVIIEKILEWLPMFLGHLPPDIDLKSTIGQQLKNGDFRGLDKTLALSVKAFPPRLKQQGKHQIVLFHSLQKKFDSMSDDDRLALGEEIWKQLNLSK